MSAPNLYHLTADLAAFEALLEDALDSGDAADAAAIDTWLEELDGTLEAKLDHYARWRAMRVAMRDARKAEAKRLADMARDDDAALDRADDAVRALMERMGKKKVEATTAKFSLVKRPAVVVVTDEAMPLPAGCTRIKVEPDKVAIKALIESGTEVPGCHIDDDRGFSLRVK